MDLVVNNGEVVEPSMSKKVVASVKKDPECKIIFSPADIASMIGNKIHNESSWLKNYKHFTFEHNLSDNTYILTYHK